MIEPEKLSYFFNSRHERQLKKKDLLRLFDEELDEYITFEKNMIPIKIHGTEVDRIVGTTSKEQVLKRING